MSLPDDRASPTHFGFAEVPLGDKQGRVDAVFHSVARRYDVMNDLMSGGLHRAWKEALVTLACPAKTAPWRHLDVAGGTGDVVIRMLEAAGPQASATLFDINAEMLAVGRQRLAERGLADRVDVIEGNAEALPFPDRSFDAYTIAFGLRNVTDIDKALRDAHRVLKPGGRFLCLEFSKVTSAPIGRAYDAYSERALPLLGRAIAGDAESYRYLHESIRRFPSQRDLARRMGEAGFERAGWRNMTLGIVALHTGWRI